MEEELGGKSMPFTEEMKEAQGGRALPDQFRPDIIRDGRMSWMGKEKELGGESIDLTDPKYGGESLDLNEKEQTFTRNLLEGKMTDEITSMAIEMIKSNDNTLSVLSPSNWASTIKNKIFIVHGANDSMVPFTESFHLHQALPNSEIFISFLYEHREMTSNKGLFFKLKEIIKMINFFPKYFKYNL